MKHYCKRGGYCRFFIVGGAPSPAGLTFRLCAKGGEIHVTDRVALGMPPQVIAGPPRTSEELGEVYA